MQLVVVATTTLAKEFHCFPSCHDRREMGVDALGLLS